MATSSMFFVSTRLLHSGMQVEASKAGILEKSHLLRPFSQHTRCGAARRASERGLVAPHSRKCTEARLSRSPSLPQRNTRLRKGMCRAKGVNAGTLASAQSVGLDALAFEVDEVDWPETKTRPKLLTRDTLGTLTVVHLKAELERRGDFKPNGKKAELVERLLCSLRDASDAPPTGTGERSPVASTNTSPKEDDQPEDDEVLIIPSAEELGLVGYLNEEVQDGEDDEAEVFVFGASDVLKLKKELEGVLKMKRELEMLRKQVAGVDMNARSAERSSPPPDETESDFADDQESAAKDRRRQRAKQSREIKGNFSNPTGMEIMFLGTSSGSPSTRRNVTSIALRLELKAFLIDCGEATQHQILSSPLRPSSIQKIFITHLHGDHIFGLPGLIADINYNRTEERTDTNEPLDIYGPPGLFRFIQSALDISSTGVAMPVVVHELTYPTERDVVGGRVQKPEVIRSKKIKNLYYDRIFPQEGANRGGVTWHPKHIVGGTPGEGYWPIYQDGEISVVSCHLNHKVECFGYVVKEADQPGHIDAAKCTALGLPPGRAYKDLKEGRAVTTKAGVEITPAEVIGPDISGRKLVILGDTCDPSCIAEVAQNADLLVHESTFHHKVHAFALKAGHSTAHMAGAFAKRIRAKQLIITHFSARYDFGGIGSDGRSDVEGGMCTIQQLVSEAKKSMGSDNVIAAEDFLRFQVPRRDPAKSGR